MEKEHFEVLLEEIRGNTQLALEGFDGVNLRLDRLESGLDGVQFEIREMRKAFGLMHCIANDHEVRLQNVEGSLQDHLKDHS